MRATRIDLRNKIQSWGPEIEGLSAKLEERKTVHEWLNNIGIPAEEQTGKRMCLLRRLAVALGVQPHDHIGEANGMVSRDQFEEVLALLKFADEELDNLGVGKMGSPLRVRIADALKANAEVSHRDRERQPAADQPTKQP